MMKKYGTVPAKVFLTLLCMASVLYALPAAAQEDPHFIGWEAIWETDPSSTVTLRDYRNDPVAAMEYFIAHAAWFARYSNGNEGLPGEGQMPLQDAIEAAISAIVVQRGETEESLAHYRISAIFFLESRSVEMDGRGMPLEEGAVVLQPPLWQIDLQGSGREESYTVYLDSDTGEMLLLHGSEVSYG